MDAEQPGASPANNAASSTPPSGPDTAGGVTPASTAEAAPSSGQGLGAGPKYTEREREYFDKLREETPDDPADDMAGTEPTDDEPAEPHAETAAEVAAPEAADPVAALLGQAPVLEAVTILQKRGIDAATILSILKTDPQALVTLAGNAADPNAAKPEEVQSIDKILAEPLKALTDVFGDEETAGKFAGPLKAVAAHAITQARAEIAPLKANLEFLTGQLEDTLVDMAASSLAGEFKQLGTPDGVKAVRKAMLDMKPGKHPSIREWMKAAAGGAFGTVSKQQVQAEMAAKDQSKRQGTPTSPSRPPNAGVKAAPMTREVFDRSIFLMREKGEPQQKIDDFRKKWEATIRRGTAAKQNGVAHAR